MRGPASSGPSRPAAALPETTPFGGACDGVKRVIHEGTRRTTKTHEVGRRGEPEPFRAPDRPSRSPVSLSNDPSRPGGRGLGLPEKPDSPGPLRSQVLPALLIGLILVATSPLQPRDLSADDGDKTAPAVSPGQALVERSLRAYGGEARVLSLNSFVFAYRIQSLSRPDSKPLSAKVYFNDSDRFRSEVQDGDRKVVTVLSGDRGWVEVAGTTLSRPAKQLSPLRNETLSLLRPDLLLLIFSRYRYSTRITEEGQPLEQLEVTGLVDGEYIRGRLSINLDTGLIDKYQYEIERATRSGTGIFRGEVRYLEYAEIHGLQSPRRVLSRKTGATSQITVTGASLGKPIDPDLFRERKSPSAPAGQP